MTPELVANIHHEGGTVLGSSRGGFDLEKILQFLNTKKITCLFVIGGDGTHRGAFRKSPRPGDVIFPEGGHKKVQNRDRTYRNCPEYFSV